MTKAFAEISQETEELRHAILAPRIPEGATELTEKDVGYAETVQQLEELYGSPIDLPTISPIPELPPEVTISAASYGVLVAVGVLLEPPTLGG